jgi:hypothetical protein
LELNPFKWSFSQCRTLTWRAAVVLRSCHTLRTAWCPLTWGAGGTITAIMKHSWFQPHIQNF